MVLRADVEISADKFETIRSFSKIMYEIPLNGTRYFDIVLEGSAADYRADFAMNKKVYFYFDETLELIGEILKRSHTSTGQLRLEGIGWAERKLQQANCPDETWTSTDTSGIIADDTPALLDYTTNVTKGSVADQSVNAFRTSKSMGLIEGVTKLCEITGQDWSIDDANAELDIEDHKGSASTIGNLMDGINIKDVVDDEDYTKSVKKVTVVGKGWGTNEVSGVSSSGWTTGDEELNIVDKSIESDTEAASYAAKLLAINYGTSFSYTFEVIDPYYSFALGDVVSVSSDRIGLDAVAQRIVKYKRIATQSSQNLFFEVRGTGEREMAADQLSAELATKRATREIGGMVQPTDDGTGDLSLSGSVTAAPSDTSVTGAVVTAGASGTGYAFGGYTTLLTADNTWRSVTIAVETANFEYFFHGIAGTFNMTFDFATPGGSVWDIYIRAYNSTDTSYYPDSTGWLIGEHVWGQDYETANVSFYLHIPESWKDKTYVLQYKVGTNTYFTDDPRVYYNYHGTRGHTHSDSFGTQDDNHPHGDNLSPTDGGHKHPD